MGNGWEQERILTEGNEDHEEGKRDSMSALCLRALCGESPFGTRYGLGGIDWKAGVAGQGRGVKKASGRKAH